MFAKRVGAEWLKYAGVLALMALCLAGGIASGASRGASPDKTSPVAVGGKADIGFAQDMIQHHQQAVTMSDIAVQRGSQRIQLLANLIRSNQLQEIGQLQGLLTAWNKPWLPESEPMAGMPMPATMHGDHEMAGGTMNGSMGGSGSMPGMATGAQLDRLRTLRGNAFDSYFLFLMMRHHQGAMPMVDDALASAKTSAVRDMAERIMFEQSTEIVQMNNARTSIGAR